MDIVFVFVAVMDADVDWVVGARRTEAGVGAGCTPAHGRSGAQVF
jgi:hypothetical protein